MTTYRAESDDLTAVADAIRTKAGTTDKLSWPTGYVSAVQGITAGSDKPNVTTTGDFHRPAEWPDYDTMTIPDDEESLYFTVDNSRHVKDDRHAINIYYINNNNNNSAILQCGTVKGGKWTVIKDFGTYTSGTTHYYEDDAPAYNYFAYRLVMPSGMTFNTLSLQSVGSVLWYKTKILESICHISNYATLFAVSYAGWGTETLLRAAFYGYCNCGGGGGPFKSTFTDNITLESCDFSHSKGLKFIGSSVFYNCSSLTSVTFPDTADFSSCTTMSNCFANCSSLTSVTFPDTADFSKVKTIMNMFQFCSKLESVDGLASVDLSACTASTQAAFQGCSSLKTITVKNIPRVDGNFAINCSSLTSITFNVVAVPTLVNTNAFNSTNSCKLYFPSALVDAAKAATNWSTYADRIEAIPE